MGSATRFRPPAVRERRLVGPSPLRGPTRRRVLRRRHWLLAIVLVALTGVGVVGASLGQALTAPGTDSTSARIAEWARGHGLGSVVSWLEQQTYQPPKVGGRPEGNSPLTQVRAAPPVPPAGSVAATLPPPIQPVASPPLPGEGHWQAIASVGGRPAMADAFLRPDATHTSYTVAAVWFDPGRVRAQLHPGAVEPGGSGWSVPSFIPPASRAGLLAAFNSGFKLGDAHGGYYQDGRYAQPLITGAASMVFFKDGSMTVGRWGRDISMGPAVAAVRQNLSLLVDHGAVVPGVADNVGNAWGQTLGNRKYVWRSGIGVTRTGGVVVVSGPRLSAQTLAVLLARTGCVRAMELDINPEWTSFIRYLPGSAPTSPRAINLLPDMQRLATRYFSVSSRDFITLTAH